MARSISVSKHKEHIKSGHGTYELQVSPKGEAGLGEAFDKCEKNPGHLGFKSVNEFSMSDLPGKYQKQDILDCIKTIEFLTCRLKVTAISPERLKSFPSSKKLYPSYKDGEGSMHTGSGWVRYLYKCNEEGRERCSEEGRKEEGQLPKTCKCPECVFSDTPSKEWWEVCVCTARHVTYDDSEVKKTEVEFSYNDKSRSTVKKLQGVEMRNCGSIDEDWCLFVCHTHDMELGQHLSDTRRLCVDLNESINKTFNGGIPSLENPLTVIVSHPHGCHKQISVGEWQDRQEDVSNKDWTKYTYDCSTCPGSSGAWVWKLGCWKGWEYLNHPHSGSCWNYLNESGFGWEPRSN